METEIIAEAIGHPNSYLWLLAGVIFLGAEALGVTGVGLLFAGLGALVVGGGIPLGLVGPEDYMMQFIVFFVATALWALLLWKPLQKFRLGNQKQEYSNIIGDTAYVGSGGISRGKGGEVTWSGTIMRAVLDKSSPVDTLEAGSRVTITAVSGATLTVRPQE